MKTTKHRLMSIGGLLILFGAIGSNPNIIFGGTGGWVLMVAGSVVLIFGATRRGKPKE